MTMPLHDIADTDTFGKRFDSNVKTEAKAHQAFLLGLSPESNISTNTAAVTA